MFLNVLAGLAGIFLVVITLRDLFNAVIVPRATAPALRMSRAILRGLWRIWPRIAYAGFSDSGKREDFLAAFAPLCLVLILTAWVMMLVAGWGLFFFAIRDELLPRANLDAAFYYAGSAVLSASTPDIIARTGLARASTLVAAATGIGVVAIVISFLFAVFGSFQRREVFVVSISARAGTPPSGTGILAVHNDLGLRMDLAKVFREAQDWTAEVMENHLAYPILILFRSSHDYQSWVGTLGALLDAGVLMLTTVELSERDASTLGQARILYDLGRHLTHDFANYFDFVKQEARVGIERHEFDAACRRLQESGYVLRDPETAWTRFCDMRKTYATQLNELARWLEIPPVQWIGDRSVLSAHSSS